MDQKLFKDAAGVATLAGTEGASADALPVGLKNALVTESLGLLPAESFSLSTGKCSDCKVPRQSQWYFSNELVAVPAMGVAASGFSPGADRRSDVAVWATTPVSAQLAHPVLVWIGSPSILEGASILPGGQRVRIADGSELDIKLVPKLSTNQAYVNDCTTEYFKERLVRMRGAMEEANGKAVFVARTIWPNDFAIDPATLTSEPVKSATDIATFVRQPGTQNTRIETRLLWERHPGQAREWKQKPVLSFVLNGAQGDNDKSLGGHFAVATGRFGNDGDWSNWAVNNFYSLDSVSEKGIIAATVPMDNYMMDLNSGQQYYRPSYMLVAILSDQRTAATFQGGVQRVFNHFYRHDFQYRHATANCVGISIDVFDSLGWRIPKRGPTARIKSIGAYVYVSIKEGCLTSGRKIYDYLNEEQTRLLPAVAFEAAGLDLLQLVGANGKPGRSLSPYEERLRTDVEAILLVRIPQVPSNRATGSAPAFSFDEFRSRVLTEHAERKTMALAKPSLPGAATRQGIGRGR